MTQTVNKPAYWYELKDLWNAFDPIGVFQIDSDWPDDEYESYILPSFELLEQKANFDELYNYIHVTVTIHMGMDQLNDKYIIEFVYQLQKWYKNLS